MTHIVANNSYRVQIPGSVVVSVPQFTDWIKRTLFPTVPHAKTAIDPSHVMAIYDSLAKVYAYRTSLAGVNAKRLADGLEPYASHEELLHDPRTTSMELVVTEDEPGQIQLEVVLVTMTQMEEEMPKIEDQSLIKFSITALFDGNAYCLFYNKEANTFVSKDTCVPFTPRPAVVYSHGSVGAKRRDIATHVKEIMDAVTTQGFENIKGMLGLSKDVAFELVPFINTEMLRTELFACFAKVAPWGQHLDYPQLVSYHVYATPVSILDIEDTPGRFKITWRWDSLLEVSWGRSYVMPLPAYHF